MFGLFGKSKKQRKAANSIGVILHNQIYKAYSINEHSATMKINTPFVTGYILGFVISGFNYQDMDGNSLAISQMKHICNGIIPNKLYKIYITNISLLQEPNDIYCNTDIVNYNEGIKYGTSDSVAVVTKSKNTAIILTKYLNDEMTKYIYTREKFD